MKLYTCIQNFYFDNVHACTVLCCTLLSSEKPQNYVSCVDKSAIGPKELRNSASDTDNATFCPVGAVRTVPIRHGLSHIVS